MHFFRVFPMFLCFFVLIGACDNNSENKKSHPIPSMELSTISKDKVRYLADDPAGFRTNITVRVVDATGNAIPGVAVMPVSDRETDSFEPASALTNAQGEAVFQMFGGAFGTSIVSAFISTSDTVDVAKDPHVNTPIEVVFDVSIQVVPLEVTYTWEKGDFTLRATLVDEESPITASVIIGSTDPEITFTEGENTITVQTSTSGTASFHVFTSKIGNVPLSFQLIGVEGSKTINVPFEGPSAGGTVFLGQPHEAAFVSARASAMALNITSPSTLNTQNPILGELASESVCPCPEPSAFQLRLPIMPPDELLISDPERQVRYNYFPIVVYDDLNNDHQWEIPETLLGARMSAGVLYYAKPEGTNPQGPLGWNLVSGLEQELQVLNWEFFHMSLDTRIRRAAFHEIHLNGEMPLYSVANRMLFAVVNPSAMNGYAVPGPWVGSMIDSLHAAPENFLPIVDVPVTSNETYELIVPTPQRTEFDDDHWLVTWTSPQGYAVSGWLVVPFLYEDANSNAAYDDGEPLRGTLKSDVNGTSLVIYYVKSYNNYEVIFNSDELGVHNGFNLLETAQVIEIQQVQLSTDTYTFDTNYPISSASTNVPFKIVRGSMTASPVATGTVTFSAENTTLISVPHGDCQNCNNVQPGDWFVILHPYDPPAFTLREWTNLNFYSGVP